MDFFNFTDRRLLAEQVDCQHIAQQFGTPCFVYSKSTIERHYLAFEDAMKGYPHLICYAVKANSNIAVLNVLAKMGSGFDIVSGGELARVLKAGGDASKVVFSGVGKTVEEIKFALEVGIKCFNVESEAELKRIAAVAKEQNKVAPISIRVNPNVDAGTHPYISTGLKENKFGIELEQAMPLFEWANQQPSLNVQGVDCHIGSQLTEIAPFLDALDALIKLIEALKAKGILLSHLDLGGGLGVPYNGEVPPHPREYATALMSKLKQYPNLTIIFEPGRAIMANAGILLTKVEYLKQNADKNFCIVDAAMNDLIRPALYSAWQKIEPIHQQDLATKVYDVVGPVCETGDFIGKERELAVVAGDILAVRSAGAYGFTMSSNYNSRPRAAEVMVDNDQAHLIRKRETIESLWHGESVIAD
ncbi:diaminopimelate decarboxylase [Psychrosphaera aestuarii]|uniref:diaminopimelate decarboxylase n=1 Tax=Psychrosphaera aestuarii TaxID=1266052 RepID=UPI001B33962B|nr:diaminopimelate decarboxylase [Psychrosphaera aestuarii]